MSDRTEDIRARVEKASCGPWQVIRKGDPDNDWLLASFGAASDDDRLVELHTDGVRGDGLSSAENDAEFCAHARTDIPYLLSALQKVEADRNRYIQRAGNAEGRLEGVEAELTALRQDNARLKGALDWMVAHEASFSVCGPPKLQMRYRGNGYRGVGYYYTTVVDNPVDALKEAMESQAALSSSPAQEQK